MKPFIFLQSDVNEIDFVCYNNPRTGKPAWYGIDNSSAFEFIQVKEENTSILSSNDQVFQDGSMYVASPVDPLFLLLEPMEKVSKTTNKENETKYRGIFLNDCLTPDLIKLTSLCDLNNICIINEVFDTFCYTFSPEKTSNWLKKKVERIQQSIDLPKDQANPVRESIGFLSDYLSKSYLELLCKEYNLSVDEIYRTTIKRKTKNNPALPHMEISSEFQQIAKNIKKPPAKKKFKPRTEGQASLMSFFKTSG